MQYSARAFTRRLLLRQLCAAPLAAGCTALGWLGRLGTARADEPERLTELGMTLSAAERDAGERFLSRHATVDVHCHAGRFFLNHLAADSAAVKALGPAFEDAAYAALRAGRVSAVVLAGVADLRLLEVSPQGVHARREFEPGEAFADYQRQIADLKEFAARPPGAAALTTPDITAAVRHQHTALVFAIEGGDFIEDQLERVHAAWREGVRVVTLVHYHVNQIGDIQTEPAVHNGLTPLGKDIVREMNRAGILIDLAHATTDVVRDVVALSATPVMISHTNLVSPSVRHPRLITLEHAKLVTDAGGVVGSVPWGIGQASFADYIDSILHLVEALGVDHVAIGTDMDAGLRPVLRSYRDWGLLPAALLARGLDEAATAKVMGGNFLRIFSAAQHTAAA